MDFMKASMLQKLHSITIVVIGGLYYKEVEKDNALLLISKSKPIRGVLVKVWECQTTRQLIRILATNTNLAVDIPFVSYFFKK